jgi:hypothetical protein
VICNLYYFPSNTLSNPPFLHPEMRAMTNWVIPAATAMISEASPQQSLAMAETIPATDSQLMDVVNGSPGSGGDQSNATSSPTSPVPSQASTSSKGPTDEVPFAEFNFVCYLPL